MAWLAVDNDDTECTYEYNPVKIDSQFWPWPDDSYFVKLPSGSIEKLIGRKLTFNDEPVEIT